ncbi:hypothetical protein SORBI_3010G133800 [Sorghum bicolor]|uniref:Uncharacterized protein n=1 Tax=Sorghum bicolor TaxID=4558 RepID=A0A194YIW4_SORBI|nr:hypothetical protein SORBI_3010G133800 [Sorghum bicolor]
MPPPLPSLAPGADPRSPPSSPIAMAFGWRRGHCQGPGTPWLRLLADSEIQANLVRADRRHYGADRRAVAWSCEWWIRQASSGADRQTVVYPPVELLGALASSLHAVIPDLIKSDMHHM